MDLPDQVPRSKNWNKTLRIQRGPEIRIITTTCDGKDDVRLTELTSRRQTERNRGCVMDGPTEHVRSLSYL